MTGGFETESCVGAGDDDGLIGERGGGGGDGGEELGFEEARNKGEDLGGDHVDGKTTNRCVTAVVLIVEEYECRRGQICVDTRDLLSMPSSCSFHTRTIRPA